MSNKISCTFDGFNILAEQLDEITTNIKPAVNECLTESHKVITDAADNAIKKHKKTGKTEASLIKKPFVEWKGNVAGIEVGFDIVNGGLPSIFLMYGTSVHGTQRTKKDQALYNAFNGKKIKDTIAEIQSNIMKKHIALGKGK